MLFKSIHLLLFRKAVPFVHTFFYSSLQEENLNSATILWELIQEKGLKFWTTESPGAMGFVQYESLSREAICPDLDKLLFIAILFCSTRFISLRKRLNCVPVWEESFSRAFRLVWPSLDTKQHALVGLAAATKYICLITHSFMLWDSHKEKYNAFYRIQLSITCWDSAFTAFINCCHYNTALWKSAVEHRYHL